MLSRLRRAVERRARHATEMTLKSGPPVFRRVKVPPPETFLGSMFRRDGTAITTDWSQRRAFLQGMKQSHWVYRAIRYLGDTISHVPLAAQVRVGEDKWERNTELPLHKLVTRPNFTHTQQWMVENFIQNLCLGGNVLWRKLRARDSGRTPVNLWPVHADQIKPVPDPVTWISGYEIRAHGREEVVPCQDIIHIQLQNPNNPYWGMGPLQAVGRVVDTEIQATEFWKMSLARMAVKDAIVSLKEPMSTEDWEEWRTLIEEEIVGPRNAHGVWLISEDVNVQPISQSPRELDFIESRRMGREDIAAAFGVPPVLIGILDRSTYSNFEQAQEHYWVNTAIPILEMLRQSLNLALVPDFGHDPADVRLWFDLSHVPALRAKLGGLVDIIKDLWSMGMPFSDAAEVAGLEAPRFAGDDVGYLPSNVLPTTGFEDEMDATVEVEVVEKTEALGRLQTPWQNELLRGLPSLRRI